MAAKKTNLKVVPVESPEDRRARLIIEDYGLQQQETEIKKARKALGAEITALMPPLAENEREVVVVADGIQAKLAWAESTVIDPLKLYTIEDGIYRDHFWRLVNVPVGAAQAMLPGDIFHEISKPVRKPLPQLTIKAIKEKA